jgi:hypothetical protein
VSSFQRSRTGLYSIELAVPGDTGWCEQARERVVIQLAAVAEQDRADLLARMPSVQIASLDEDDAAELILQWVAWPASHPWQAIETVVNEVVKVVMPDLLDQAAVRMVAIDERVFNHEDEAATRSRPDGP